VCDFNPFTGIEASCNRSVFKEQNISLKQAIKMYSENAAKFLLNDKIGKIKKGMNADLIVLDKDIYRIKKDEIKTIKPLLVIVNGKIVYNNLGLLK
jgi:predicted amidohydrolase YtcJ